MTISADKKIKIKKEIQDMGYTLLNEYNGVSSKLETICENGHRRYCNIESLRKYKCKQCEIKNKISIAIEDVESRGYNIIKMYEKAKDAMILECPNKHIRICTIGNFRNHINCPECYGKNVKYTLSQVRNIFNEQGCILLEDTYTNCKTKMKYICKCGNNDEVTLDSFISRGNGMCRLCMAQYFSENYREENASQWNGGLSEVKTYVRNNISEWKKISMKLCNYKCVVSGDDFDDIHHVESFNTLFEKLVKSTDFKINQLISEHSNYELEIIREIGIELHLSSCSGVCLTNEIHKEFHSIYGNRNNNRKQFLEFISDKYPNRLEFVENILNKDIKSFFIQQNSVSS